VWSMTSPHINQPSGNVDVRLADFGVSRAGRYHSVLQAVVSLRQSREGHLVICISLIQAFPCLSVIHSACVYAIFI